MLISYKLIAEGRFLRVNKGSLITIKRNKVNTLYILQGIYCLDLIDLPVQWKAMKNKGFKKESERWTHISKDIWQKETPRSEVGEYEKALSLVVIFSSIHTILVLVARVDLELVQIGVKCYFMEI